MQEQRPELFIARRPLRDFALAVLNRYAVEPLDNMPVEVWSVNLAVRFAPCEPESATFPVAVKL